MNEVKVLSGEKRFEKFEKNIKSRALRALKTLKADNVAVYIYLMGDEAMRILNKKFRNRAKATSVLSFEEPADFPHPEAEKNKKFIGEIYLGPDQVNKKKNSLTLNDILIHGLLHLFSYDHKGRQDSLIMEKMEKIV